MGGRFMVVASIICFIVGTGYTLTYFKYRKHTESSLRKTLITMAASIYGIATLLTLSYLIRKF